MRKKKNIEVGWFNAKEDIFYLKLTYQQIAEVLLLLNSSSKLVRLLSG